MGVVACGKQCCHGSVGMAASGWLCHDGGMVDQDGGTVSSGWQYQDSGKTASGQRDGGIWTAVS